MTDITPAIPVDRQVIQSYGDGGFRISDVRHEGAVIVLPGRTVPWPVGSIAELTSDSLAPVHEAAADVGILLLGCGPQMTFVPSEVRRQVREWGIVIDPMDTGAACRTYNVLLSEARRVAAALLPVD